MKDRFIKDEKARRIFKANAGELYVMLTKHIALEAACLLATKKENELLEYFHPDIIRSAKLFKKDLSVEKEASICLNTAFVYAFELGEGGLMTALWRLACVTGAGMEIDLKSVPIRQETIEICEYFSLNPYETRSGGSLLMVTDDEKQLREVLAKEGIQSSVCGVLNKGSDCIIRRGETAAFLNRPGGDRLSETLKDYGVLLE